MPTTAPTTPPEVWCIADAAWMAEELGARHYWCVDLPAVVPPGVAVWVPGKVAAVWQAQGNAPAFRSWGAAWPHHIPPDLLGNHRAVYHTLPPPYLGRMFTKLADAKDTRFPAQLRTYTELVGALGLVGDTAVIVAPPRVYATEVRVFYSTTGTTWCTYQHAGHYYDGEVPLPEPAGFCPPPMPPGIVVDYGRPVGTGVWEVVEYNAAWSSAWYGCDVRVVRQAVADSYAAPHLPLWVPDALYRRYAATAARRYTR